MLREKRFTYRKIKEILSVLLPTICKWVNREDLVDRTRVGRPRKIVSSVEEIRKSESLDK